MSTKRTPEPGSIYVHSIGDTRGVIQMVLRFHGSQEQQAEACRKLAELYVDARPIAAAPALMDALEEMLRGEEAKQPSARVAAATMVRARAALEQAGRLP